MLAGEGVSDCGFPFVDGSRPSTPRLFRNRNPTSPAPLKVDCASRSRPAAQLISPTNLLRAVRAAPHARAEEADTQGRRKASISCLVIGTVAFISGQSATKYAVPSGLADQPFRQRLRGGGGRLMGYQPVAESL